MWIGAGRLVLDFFGNTNESLKHDQLESLLRDLRKKFNVSALEVADFEDLERCVIGFSFVSPQGWKRSSVESFVKKICETVDQTAFARVVSEETEIYSLGDPK